MDEKLDLPTRIRILLAQGPAKDDWTSQLEEIFGCAKGFLADPKLSEVEVFQNLSRPEWGQFTVSQNDEGLTATWLRTDGGPPVAVQYLRETSRDGAVFVVLQALLAHALQEQGLGTYVDVRTPNWRRARVVVNGKEMEGVVRACAVTGFCEVITPKSKVGPDNRLATQKLRGLVTITFDKVDRTFF